MQKKILKIVITIAIIFITTVLIKNYTLFIPGVYEYNKLYKEIAIQLDVKDVYGSISRINSAENIVKFDRLNELAENVIFKFYTERLSFSVDHNCLNQIRDSYSNWESSSEKEKDRIGFLFNVVKAHAGLKIFQDTSSI